MSYYLRRRTRRDGTPGDRQAVHNRTHNGKRITQSQTFPTQKEAKAWGAAQDHKYNRNPNADPTQGKTPFAELVEQWEAVLFPKLAPKSQDRYERVFRTHLLPEFGDAPVNSIDRPWIRRFLAALQAEQKPNGQPSYAPGTVHKVLTTLSSIMSEAVEAHMIDANPCRDVRKRLLRKEQHKLTPLSPAEVDALAVEMAKKHAPYGLLTQVAAYTGLRAGELHALRKRDVDQLRGELHVVRTLKTWRSGEAVFGLTKSEERRTVVLAPELRDLLAAHIPQDAHPTTSSSSACAARGRFIRWRSCATTSSPPASSPYPTTRTSAGMTYDTRS